MKTLPPGPVIQVNDLGKIFHIGTKQEKESFLGTTRRLINGYASQRELWALRHVSFKVERGETLGVIGPNGAGKSTLLLLLSQILSPTEGECRIESKTHCFFRIGAALQPRLTVLENFSLCSSLLGLSRSEYRRRLPAMIDFSGLQDYLYAKYGELSSGLAARLPFAAAVHTDLEIILVDEMLLVGDRQFQAKCLKTFHEFKAQGKTLVIVSHSLPMIEALCPRTLYLNAGKPAFLGDSATAVRMLIRDQGNSGQAEHTPAGDAAGKSGWLPRGQLRKIVEAAAHRITGELAAYTEESRAAVSREFSSGQGAAAEIPDKQVREIIDMEVRRLAPELRKAAGDVRKAEAPPSAPVPPSAHFKESYPQLIREIVKESVETGLYRIQLELKASMETYRRTMEREREDLLASAREAAVLSPETRHEAPPSLGKEVNPEVELAWKALLGHQGPLAVCSSSQGAFGAVLQGLNACPGKSRVEPGDEVILSSVVWPWVINGLRGYGLVPVFADMDTTTCNLDPAQLSAAMSDKTRAVILAYNGNTCPQVERIAEFCAEKGLRLIEMMSSAARMGQYNGRFIGLRGDFSVIFPKKTNFKWGVALSPQESVSEVFRQIAPARTPYGMPPARTRALGRKERGTAYSAFLCPAKAGGISLSAALMTAKKWHEPMDKLRDDFSCYVDFFSVFSDTFTIPTPPSLARLGSSYFLMILNKDAPFTAADVFNAKLSCAAQSPESASLTMQYPDGSFPFRQTGCLPHTVELMERGIIFPVLHGEKNRKEFFEEFRRWLELAKKGAA